MKGKAGVCLLPVLSRAQQLAQEVFFRLMPEIDILVLAALKRGNAYAAGIISVACDPRELGRTSPCCPVRVESTEWSKVLLWRSRLYGRDDE